MKKDRNAFFQESGYYNQSSFNVPNMNNFNQPMMSPQNPNFYPNQAIPNNYNIPVNQNTSTLNQTDYTDIESRLSKLERQISRIDARITKLESNYYPVEEIDNTTNMYMV